jgi:hypothetical protein
MFASGPLATALAAALVLAAPVRADVQLVFPK